MEPLPRACQRPAGSCDDRAPGPQGGAARVPVRAAGGLSLRVVGGDRTTPGRARALRRAKQRPGCLRACAAPGLAPPHRPAPRGLARPERSAAPWAREPGLPGAERLLLSPRAVLSPFQEAAASAARILEVGFLLRRCMSSKPMDGAELPQRRTPSVSSLGVSLAGGGTEGGGRRGSPGLWLSRSFPSCLCGWALSQQVGAACVPPTV